MKCKLTRLSSNHQNLRSDEIVGETDQLPVVGDAFRMTGPPFNPNASIRLVVTTSILEVEQIDEKKMEFKTKNSHYAFEQID